MPSVRIRRDYNSIADEDEEPSPLTQGSDAPPAEPGGRTRSRTMTSIFTSPFSTTSERRGLTTTSRRRPTVSSSSAIQNNPGTSSSGPTSSDGPRYARANPPEITVYPDTPAINVDGEDYVDPTPRTRSWVEHSIMSNSPALRNRRRTGTMSSMVPPSTGYSTVGRTGTGFLEVPPNPASDTDLSEPRGRGSASLPASRIISSAQNVNETRPARAQSVARGGRGTSVGVRISQDNIQSSEVIAAIERDVEADAASRQHSAANLSHHDHEDEEGSDYTTDGSEFDEDEHHLDEIVDHLEVIDPQVAVVSHLSNAANSILIPRLPIYSRRPVVTLPTITPSDTVESFPHLEDTPLTQKPHEKHHIHVPKRKRKTQDQLDAHVEHVLKRRAKLRRQLKGLRDFLRTPVGIVTGIYGFLVVFWGAAIVLFLLKWINLHNTHTQKFWVEISSQVVNALFTVTGVGFIPWRILDTYHIVRIWYFKRLDRNLRKERGLPPLENEDDLPDPALNPNFTHVLTEQQQAELKLDQKRFMKSQTWYRPHATDTHRAFPIGTALAICLFIDANSVFQCLLCGAMWGLNEYTRPPWTTGSLIPLSFLCGIAGGVLISRGSSKSKKTKEVENKLRNALKKEHARRKQEILNNADGDEGENDTRRLYAQRAGLVGVFPPPGVRFGDEEKNGDTSNEKQSRESAS